MPENAPINATLRIVIDTNVFVSATLNRRSGSALIVNAWHVDKKFTLVTCRQAVNEILRVLAYPRIRIKYGVQPSEAYRIAEYLYKRAVWVEPKGEIDLCRDETDNFLLETAILGEADFLVSGDKDLVDDEKLKAKMLKHGVKVIGVAEFIGILRERGLI
ncbi:MAG: putative toxin-antitoxin system toxin component, PIN family [Chloroflexota bacterium]|nr:putative toxin-antitoxin system toxin component, PIN family [Chloroflexota bacterium]